MHTHLGRARRAGHPLIALTAALVCGLALASCGGDGSDEDQVRAVAEQLSSSDAAACGKLTEDFLKQQFGTKGDCERQAEQGDGGAKPKVEEVKVDGESATAVVVDGDRSTVTFVKEDGDWLASGIQIAQDDSEPDKAAGPPDDPDSGDEAEARAAASSLLVGAQGDDPAVLCAVLSERYANELTGAKEFGLEECADRLGGGRFADLQSTLKGVEVQTTTVAPGGQSASVGLSNGDTVELIYQNGRFVIDGF